MMLSLQPHFFLPYTTRITLSAHLARHTKRKSNLRSSSSNAVFSSDDLSGIPNPLPAAFLRGGTSKGIFINRRHLPRSQELWDQIFRNIMGSPDPEHGRQLNGMGGGVSSLSKIMVVGPPSDQTLSDIDAEYTFAQVGIRDGEIDYTGNCGNLSSVVGIFAVDEGICVPRIIQSRAGDILTGRVHTWNTNTKKEFHTTFPVTPDLKPALDLSETSIAGVPGRASRISLESIDPAGAKTGKLLPTGNPIDKIKIEHMHGNEEVAVSLVDATNPTIFMSSEYLNGSSTLPGQELYLDPDVSGKIERIRQAGAVAMGLNPASKAQPKITIIGAQPRIDKLDVLTGDPPADIEVHAMSMGVLHRAIPMTVGLCLGVAAGIQGTIPHRLLSDVRSRQEHLLFHERDGLIRIRHPSGNVDVGAEFSHDHTPTRAKVARTGRRLMQGAVWW